MNNFTEKANFIWSVADLLRGPYRPNQYKDVMLPMTVLRRLDCVLESTKDAVLAKLKSLKDSNLLIPRDYRKFWLPRGIKFRPWEVSHTENSGREWRC
jgi:type I restriction-modification system DNA methylase subunit